MIHMVFPTRVNAYDFKYRAREGVPARHDPQLPASRPIHWPAMKSSIA